MGANMIVNPTDRISLTDTKLQELIRGIIGEVYENDCEVRVNSDGGFAIGDNAVSNASGIQLGKGTNSEDGTLQIYSYELLNSEGHIPLERLPEIVQRLEALEYEDITISSFKAVTTSGSSTVFEVGTSTPITISWTITGGTTDGNTITLNGTTVTGSSKTDTITSTTSYTLIATDGTTSATKTATVSGYNYTYYGAAATPTTLNKTFLQTLTKTLKGSRAGTFTASPGTNQYIYYAYPSTYGAATFTVGGFAGGFTLVDTITITNTAGTSVSYYVYKSDNANLGSTTVTVS